MRRYTLHQFDEECGRDDPKIKEELMMISHNIDPYSGNRMITRNAFNWQSRNSRYTYRRTKKNETTWIVGVYPNEMDAETYYDDPIYSYEIIMPKEFLEHNLFEKINIGLEPE